MSNKFQLDVGEIKLLNQVQNKPDEVKEYLTKHGGVEGVLKKLKVDPLKGLSNNNKQDLLDRQEQYGVNSIPTKPPKSFFMLMFEALQDVTIIILIVCAIVSLGLSFAHFDGAPLTEEFKNESGSMINIKILKNCHI